MNDQIITDNRVSEAKNGARLLYLVHGATFLFSLGLLSIVPLVFNYSKRDATQGTFVHSHHSWMIRSFWWYMVWMVVGGIFAATVIGLVVAFPIWGVAWLWKAYRLIRGFLDLENNKAMPT